MSEETEALDDMGANEEAANQTGSCPDCGGKIVIRENRKTLNEFMGCSNYPQCKWTTST